MHTLVFDTTGNGIGIGLYDEENPVAKTEKVMEFGQAEALAEGVARILQDREMKFSDIGLLGVCSGPGSFTGVRAGLAFARGLALGAPEVAVTGVSAFEVYADMLKEKDRAMYNAVIIETKREDFYFQLFDKDLNKLCAPSALRRDEIVRMLKSRQTSFIGDGAERFLSVCAGLQIKAVELSQMTDVDGLFRVTRKKYFAKNLDFPKPLYIRGADTCVK